MMNSVLQPFINYFHMFTNTFSNIQIQVYTVIISALVFILLHHLRHKPILKTISIYTSFFPVLTHELGHALVAQITGGHVADIQMIMTARKQNATGKQGYAKTLAKHRISFILIAFAGYIAAPLMLFLGFYFVKQQLSFVFVGICFVFILFYLTHTKQKWIPLILLICVLYIGYAIFVETNPIILSSINLAYSIYLGLLLGETIQSIIITTKIVFSRSKQAWDGTNLEQLTHIPQHFWWLVWVIISSMVILHILRNYILG